MTYTQLLSKIENSSKVTLIAVSKQRSVEEILALYEQGCRDFGENRVSEALNKMAKCPPDINWHFIGTLQTKKIPKVIGNFSLIHSVDSWKLAEKISKCSAEKKMATSILLQVNTSGEESKHGFTPATCRKIPQLPHINIEGLMTMAPLTEDKVVIRSCFSKLRELRDELGLHHLSMGMSNDWQIAIEEGATLLRIGSKLFN